MQLAELWVKNNNSLAFSVMIRLLRKDTVCATPANVWYRRARVKFWTRMTKRWWRSFMTLDMTWYVDSRCAHEVFFVPRVTFIDPRPTRDIITIVLEVSTAECESFICARWRTERDENCTCRSRLRATFIPPRIGEWMRIDSTALYTCPCEKLSRADNL